MAKDIVTGMEHLASNDIVHRHAFFFSIHIRLFPFLIFYLTKGIWRPEICYWTVTTESRCVTLVNPGRLKIGDTMYQIIPRFPSAGHHQVTSHYLLHLNNNNNSWQCLEALMHHKYSSLSDVWSFGIGTMLRAIKPLLTLFFI